MADEKAFADVSNYSPDQLRNAVNGDEGSLRRAGESMDRTRERLTDIRNAVQAHLTRLKSNLEGNAANAIQDRGRRLITECDEVLRSLERSDYLNKLNGAAQKLSNTRLTVTTALTIYEDHKNKAGKLMDSVVAAPPTAGAVIPRVKDAVRMAVGALALARSAVNQLGGDFHAVGNELRSLPTSTGNSRISQADSNGKPVGADGDGKTKPVDGEVDSQSNGNSGDQSNNSGKSGYDGMSDEEKKEEEDRQRQIGDQKENESKRNGEEALAGLNSLSQPVTSSSDSTAGKKQPEKDGWSSGGSQGGGSGNNGSQAHTTEEKDAEQRKKALEEAKRKADEAVIQGKEAISELNSGADRPGILPFMPGSNNFSSGNSNSSSGRNTAQDLAAEQAKKAKELADKTTKEGKDTVAGLDKDGHHRPRTSSADPRAGEQAQYGVDANGKPIPGKPTSTPDLEAASKAVREFTSGAEKAGKEALEQFRKDSDGTPVTPDKARNAVEAVAKQAEEAAKKALDGPFSDKPKVDAALDSVSDKMRDEGMRKLKELTAGGHQPTVGDLDKIVQDMVRAGEEAGDKALAQFGVGTSKSELASFLSGKGVAGGTMPKIAAGAELPYQNAPVVQAGTDPNQAKVVAEANAARTAVNSMTSQSGQMGGMPPMMPPMGVGGQQGGQNRERQVWLTGDAGDWHEEQRELSHHVLGKSE